MRWGALLARLPAPLWRLIWPLMLPHVRKAGERAVEQLLIIVLAEALKALRGTEAYRTVIKSAAEQVKALIPGGSVEPVIADMLADLSQALKQA